MTKSKAAIQALADMDPQFAEMCDQLFGKALDPVDIWAYVYTPEGVSKMLADTEVRKANPDQADLNATGRGRLVRRGPRFESTGRRKDEFRKADDNIKQVVGGKLKRKKLQVKAEAQDNKKLSGLNHPAILAHRKLSKADEANVVWDVEFVKADADKHQVFGWASIVEMDGQPIVDRQGDWIPPEEIEKAAYTYVVKSRAGGHQHKRTETGEVFKASDMIESFVITDEKVAKMGLPDDTPRGWWIGYHVSDDDAWERIKDGRVTGFSIHGRGKRKVVAEA